MTAAYKKKLFLPLASGVVLAGILAVPQFGFSIPAQAASPSASTCSVATLDGTYVFSGHGEAQVTGNTKVPLAVAGIQVFDGQGRAHGFYSQSMGGKISRRVSFTATYTLKPDCTGTHTATDDAGTVRRSDQYSLPSGSRVTFIGADPGIVFSGVGVSDTKKVS